MLAGFLLALREGIEAALILGILLGTLRKLQRPDLASYVWSGSLAAVVTSVGFSIGLNLANASLEGKAEEIFEGITMLLAASMLTWMIFWMRRQSSLLRERMEENVRRAVGTSGRWSLFSISFLSVVREGIELALFLVALGFNSSQGQMLFGAALGLGTAALSGWLLFTSTRRLPLMRFFQVTNILLVLFAAGLVAHGVHELVEAGWIPAVINPIYNVNFLLSNDSLPGQLLRALFGYNDSPSLAETMAYLVYFLLLAFSLVWVQRRPAIVTAG